MVRTLTAVNSLITSNIIRVLVVDDSLFIRKSIASMIETEPDIKVIAQAKDGIEAVEFAKQHKPDVITLDVDMPRLDGIEALKIIMKESPTPVLMVSSLTEEGAKETFEALDNGALDFIDKNLQKRSINITKIENVLVSKIRNLYHCKHLVNKRWEKRKESISPVDPNQTRNFGVVTIGVSTGGPKALMDILPLIPEDFPVPIIIGQHMPKNFLPPFVRRLNGRCKLKVQLIEHRMKLEEKGIYFAPGGINTQLSKTENGLYFKLEERNEERLYSPDIDCLIKSIAEVFQNRTLGIIMTGMGQDGLEGIRKIKEQKGKCLVQDQKTSVVFGMPRCVIENELADQVIPLERIIHEMMDQI